MKPSDPEEFTDDALAPAAHTQDVADAPFVAQDEVLFESGRDLLSEEDLKAVMFQFNPQASKDITTIQKGVENFFLFQQSHLALTQPEQLQHLGERDLKLLAERGAVVPFQYITLSEDRSRLLPKAVLIRPASLKAEQVNRVKMGCVRGSVIAILEYIHERDRKLRTLEAEGQLGQWVSQRFLRDGLSGKGESRAELNQMIAALRNLSFDGFLANEVQPVDELLIPVLSLLGKRSAELLADLTIYAKVPQAAEEALNARMPRSLLVPLARDFHLLQPPASDLIAMPNSTIKETRSEIEYIYLLYVQLARKILLALLPREETAWISAKGVAQDERYLEELEKHPSFTQGDQWAEAVTFLQCFAGLIRHVRVVREVRKEYLIDLITQETVFKLNMQFEPLLLSPETFEVADSNVDAYIPRDELYRAVCERMKSLEDVAFMEEQRAVSGPRGLYFIFRANLPRAFIRHPNRRSYIHLFCRSNGMGKGIYDLLINVTEGQTPEGIVDEQIALARAIREWEDELEKERRRRERAALGFFGLLLAFLRKLFGLAGADQNRQGDDSRGGEDRPVSEKKASASERRKRSGVIKGPRSKEIVVPARVQKAVDYVERNFKGLIWLDEVMTALNTVKFTRDQVGDMLFYDKYDRYLEVRPLINIRRVFISRENEDDPAWIQSTLDYLENVTPQKPEHRALIDFLRS